jgi:hypothetical protein
MAPEEGAELAGEIAARGGASPGPRPLRSAPRRLARATLGALADLLSKAFVRRRGAPPWGLDAREPPYCALVIRAGTLTLTRRVVQQILHQYPATDVSVLAPVPMAEETKYEAGVPIIAAAASEGCGYSIGSGPVRLLRNRRFDTVIVAGEGNQRAELIALLSGADRRVEVREDGAAHVFWFAGYKPISLAATLVAGALDRITLSALVGLVWGSIAVEGRLWRLRRALAGRRATAADAEE